MVCRFSDTTAPTKEGLLWDDKIVSNLHEQMSSRGSRNQHFPPVSVARGVSVIEIGSREFMCVGANPPFDHPHVFLDLGNDNEIICPYCSTLYRFAADLGAGEARPPECVLKDKVA